MDLKKLIYFSPPLPASSPTARIVFSKTTFSPSQPLGIKQRIRGAARDLMGSIFSVEFLSLWTLTYGAFAIGILPILSITGGSVFHPLVLLAILGFVLMSAISVIGLMQLGIILFLVRPQELLNLHLFPDLLNIYNDRFVLSWTKKGAKKDLHIAWSWIKNVRLNDYLYMGVIPLPVLEIELSEIPSSLFQCELLNKLALKGTLEEPATKRLTRAFPLGGVRLPLPLFGLSHDVELLIQVIREKVGSDVLDNSLSDRFAADNLESFTALWLADLNSNPQQSLTRQLAQGTSLQGGAYIITGVLGHGGFSVVYQAHDKGEDRVVAIKEIVCNFGGTNRSVEKNLRRMLHEASVLSRLNHPHIVKFERCFAEGNRLYLVMEALTGRNLREFVLSEQRLEEAQLKDIAQQCCSILDYLHAQSEPIVHRDFTPDNLMFTNDTIKLVDFNIAQSAITSSSGTIVGKHCFMAPEQFCGEYTTSGDLYQLGATLYFLASGEDPEPLGPFDLTKSRTDLSNGFHDLVNVLTDRTPGNRPASARDVLNLIQSPTVPS